MKAVARESSRTMLRRAVRKEKQVSLGWRDALMNLHFRGWDADDIDLGAEALCETCAEGVFEDREILDLPDHVVQLVLGDDLTKVEVAALRVIADLRGQETAEAAILRRAIYDLDAFADAFADGDASTG